MAAATLARLLKAQRLLASGEDDVSATIRQALEEIHHVLTVSGDLSPEAPTA